MMSGAPPTHPIYLIVGFGAFFLCGLLASRKIDIWRKVEGFAPPPSFTREGNREYKKLLWRTMPDKVKRQVRILQFTGFFIAVVGMWLAA